MRTIYLDQNQWIALARAIKYPKERPELEELPDRIISELNSNRIIIPITFTNIYETQKINSPIRRRDIALVQSIFSRGLVFRGRQQRNEMELKNAILKLSRQPPQFLENDWFISKIFFESVGESDSIMKEAGISKQLFSLVQSNPAQLLFDYLVNIPNDSRIEAVRRFSIASEKLRTIHEERRTKTQSETPAMRRRIYGALLMMDNAELILNISNEIGVAWKQISDIGDSNVRRLIDEVPNLHIERELAIKLEAQQRSLSENDFRDMQSFCAVMPYADLVIAENQFISLARQAKLDQKYGTRLETKLSSFTKVLDEWGP